MVRVYEGLSILIIQFLIILFSKTIIFKFIIFFKDWVWNSILHNFYTTFVAHQFLDQLTLGQVSMLLPCMTLTRISYTDVIL